MNKRMPKMPKTDKFMEVSMDIMLTLGFVWSFNLLLNIWRNL